MKASKVLFLVFIIVTSLQVVNAQPVRANPQTIIVPDDYLTIGWAIGNSSEGDTIFVKKGTYYEHVTINKSISLVGENRITTIIDGGGVGNVTEVRVGNVAIEGFTIKDSGTKWPNGGITLGNVKNCFIAGNIATGNRRGIALFGASNNSISGNILTNNLEGIVLSESSNNSVSGNKITGSDYGISHWDSFNNVIFENNITNNEEGIELWFSSKNVIQENNITENTEYGIKLWWSFDNTLRGNRIADSRYNFAVSGNLTELVNDVDTSNTVDDKPIYYWINKRDMTVPIDAGYVALINCTGITVEDLNLTRNYNGLLLAYTTNSTIAKNKITDNECGILLSESTSSSICGNNIIGNFFGISLGHCSNITITENNITHNHGALGLCEASDNRFYHNNFIENIGLIGIPIGDYEPSKNVWDDGYPSGGNYWSNYTGVDLYSGQYQNEVGSDGIGDISLDVDVDNQDEYPLMGPISFFNACTWDETTYHVHTVSNSTVSDFCFSRDHKRIIFNVTGPDATLGFCRVSIPNGLLWCDALEEWNVTINGNPPTYLKAMEETDYTYLYFTYNHSIQEVQIEGIHVIPEFPTLTSMLLLFIVLTVATAIYKRRLCLE